MRGALGGAKHIFRRIKHVAGVFRNWDKCKRLLVHYESIAAGHSSPAVFLGTFHGLHRFLGSDDKGGCRINELGRHVGRHSIRAHRLYTKQLGNPAVDFRAMRPISAPIQGNLLAKRGCGPSLAMTLRGSCMSRQRLVVIRARKPNEVVHLLINRLICLFSFVLEMFAHIWHICVYVRMYAYVHLFLFAKLLQGHPTRDL